MRGVSNPICCDELTDPYFVGFYTIVDCSKWIDKQKREHQFELKLFPARKRTLKKFERKYEQHKGFKFFMFTAARDDEKEAGVGSEFEFVRKADPEKLLQVVKYKKDKLIDLIKRANESGKAEIDKLCRTFAFELKDDKIVPALVPFNYKVLLYPPTEEEVRTLLRRADKSQQKSGGGNRHFEDDDIPF